MLDYYIVDEEKRTVRATSDDSLGMDFSKIYKLNDQFENFIMGKEKVITKISMEGDGKSPRKWAYVPTIDHKYVLEIGLSNDILDKYVKGIDFQNMEKKIVEGNPYIKAVEGYNSHYERIGHGIFEQDEDIKRKIDEVVMTKRILRKYNDLNMIEEEYIYHDPDNGFMGDEDKVIAVYFDYTNVMNQLNHLTKSYAIGLIIFCVVAVFILWVLTTRYITSPLVALSDKMRNISYNNLNFMADLNRTDEIGQLELSFNLMVEKLKNTIISNTHFENIINSVGDVLVIIDEDMNIKKLNLFAINLLGYGEEELIDAPISVLFELDFRKEHVMSSLETKMTVDGLENSVVKSSGEMVPTLLSISKIENEDNSVSGYVITAKDMTTVKKNLVKLEQIAEKLEKEKDYLAHISNLDGLTGIYNRRKIFNCINSIIESTKMSGLTFSVLMLDVDYFKQINDKYGHQVGDRILVEVANLLSHSIRKDDLVGRYGGEEFLIVLRNQKIEDAYLTAKRIREIIELNEFTLQIRITASIGIARYPEDGLDKSTLLKHADSAMYHAKEKGRNNPETY